jgi:hypothetical protein
LLGICALRAHRRTARPATQAYLARQTVPGAVGFATGLEIRDEPFPRVPWRGVPVTPRLVAIRAGNLALALLPLALAVAIFDRFDPAADVATEAAGARHLPIAPVAANPSAWAAVLAEARLIWGTAGFWRWPLAASAIAAAGWPVPGAIAFLLLLVPVVSEVAAREKLAGAQGLVFSQPGVPSSVVLWKTAATALFLLVLATPLVLRSMVASPSRGLCALLGVLFVAGAAAGMGSLTAGGGLAGEEPPRLIQLRRRVQSGSGLPGRSLSHAIETIHQRFPSL